MKLSRHILLVSEDKECSSLLRFVLRNSSYRPDYPCYQVTSDDSAQEALDSLRTEQYDLILALYPLKHIDTLIERARVIDKSLKTLVLASNASQVFAPFADALLFKPTTAEVLERIKSLVCRKRGPHQGWKKEVAKEVFQLGEEKVA